MKNNYIYNPKNNTYDLIVIKRNGDFLRYTIDADFYEYAVNYRWYANGKEKYATRWKWGKSIKLCHDVINVPNGVWVDHINRNVFDNRRENLRVCTVAENNRNRKPRNKYKGVSFHKCKNKYSANICYRSKTHYIGDYSTPEEAAQAYDIKAKELFGEFAYLNFGENE
jgi:hypothetical protein